jgi:hypothetical protein
MSSVSSSRSSNRTFSFPALALSMGDPPGIAFKALAGLLRQFRARTEQRNRRPRSWHKRR